MDKPAYQKVVTLIPRDLSGLFDGRARAGSPAVFPFCRNEDLWARQMPIPSRLAEAILTRDLPDDFSYNISLSGSEGWLFLDGNGASDSRKFDLASGIAYPGDLVVRNDTQYQGWGRLILRNQIEFFHAAGLRKMEINAAREAGAYSWARMGFLPEMPLDAGFQRDLKRRYELISPFLDMTAASASLPVTLLRAQDLWAVADAATDVAPLLPDFFKTAAQSFSGIDKETSNTISVLFAARLAQGHKVTLGQFLLAGQSYRAFIDLGDAAQLQRAGNYAGGWRYIGFTGVDSARHVPDSPAP